MNVIEKFFIAIGVDAKGVDKEIKKVVNSASSTLKHGLSGQALLGARALALAAVAAAGYIKNTYEEIAALDKLSKTLGTSTERLQMWQGAAKDAGVATDEIGKTWQRMNTMITETSASGRGALADFVNAGVLPGLQTVDGKLKDTETYMLEMADALAAMDAQTRSVVGSKLGIRDNAMLEFLAQGSGAINQQLGHIKELGLYTKEDLEITREFQKSVKELKKEFNDFIRTVKNGLLPLYRTVVPYGTKLIRHWRVFIPLIGVAAALITKTMIPAILALGKALFGLVASNPYLLAIAAALAAIGLIFEDILVWMEGGESVIGEYLGDFETVSATMKDVFGHLENFPETIKQAFAFFPAMIKDLAKTFFEFFGRDGQVAKSFDEMCDRLKESFWDFIRSVKEWIADAFNFSGKIRSIEANVGTLARQYTGGSTDNSQHSTSVVQNNTFNGVSGAQDAANRLMGNNPIPAADGAYR